LDKVLGENREPKLWLVSIYLWQDKVKLCLINNTRFRIMTQPFQFANGQVAHSAEDLLELCKQFPVDGTNYLVREDLEKWLAYIGKDDIAQCAVNARQTALEDRQKLEEFLKKCHALSSPEQQAAVPETPQVAESPGSTVVKTVETSEQAVSEKTESPVVEQPENLTPVATTTSTATSVNNSSPVTTESDNKPTPAAKLSETSEKKPSFFRVIARLIVNVLYRNRN
jgi:hypothetical protein